MESSISHDFRERWRLYLRRCHCHSDVMDTMNSLFHQLRNVNDHSHKGDAIWAHPPTWSNWGDMNCLSMTSDWYSPPLENTSNLRHAGDDWWSHPLPWSYLPLLALICLLAKLMIRTFVRRVGEGATSKMCSLLTLDTADIHTGSLVAHTSWSLPPTHPQHQLPSQTMSENDGLLTNTGSTHEIARALGSSIFTSTRCVPLWIIHPTIWV